MPKKLSFFVVYQTQAEGDAPGELSVEPVEDKQKAIDYAAELQASGKATAKPVVIAGNEVHWKPGAVEVKIEGSKAKSGTPRKRKPKGDQPTAPASEASAA